LAAIKREHQWLQTFIADNDIDLVISDNRYGLHTQQVPCIFITHQLTIKAPCFAEKIIQFINYQYINRYTECWVPDMANKSLSVAGLLSHPNTLPKIPVKHIGLLSRFGKNNQAIIYNYCILLSGPEPQRSLLEAIILQQIAALDGKILLVRGLPANQQSIATPANVTVVNHLQGNKIGRAHV
jgi:hypothetical protein